MKVCQAADLSVINKQFVDVLCNLSVSGRPTNPNHLISKRGDRYVLQTFWNSYMLTDSQITLQMCI